MPAGSSPPQVLRCRMSDYEQFPTPSLTRFLRSSASAEQAPSLPDASRRRSEQWSYSYGDQYQGVPHVHRRLSLVVFVGEELAFLLQQLLLVPSPDQRHHQHSRQGHQDAQHHREHRVWYLEDHLPSGQPSRPRLKAFVFRSAYLECPNDPRCCTEWSNSLLVDGVHSRHRRSASIRAHGACDLVGGGNLRRRSIFALAAV